MKPSRRSAILTALLVLVASGIVRAQTDRAHIGPHIGYNFDVEELALGAQFSVPILHHVEFYPSFDYYFVDDGSLWAVNADIKWRVARDRPRWLYIGGGLDLMHASFEGNGNTDAGLNLFVGAESLRGRIHPFVEFRTILADNSSVQLQGGVNITLGRHP